MWMDEYIPNFSFFLLVLAPIMLMILFVTVLIDSWLKHSKKKKGLSWISWVLAFYLIIPGIRGIEYMWGMITYSQLLHGLFVTDFGNFMVLSAIVGIIQIIFILRKVVRPNAE